MTDKMTPEKAIACINDVLSSTINFDESLEYEMTSYDIDWLEEAKKALEKQIPKKPNETQHIATRYDYTSKIATRFFRGCCPKCGTLNNSRKLGTETTFCKKMRTGYRLE